MSAIAGRSGDLHFRRTESWIRGVGLRYTRADTGSGNDPNATE
jgi:hypothetical protein